MKVSEFRKPAGKVSLAEASKLTGYHQDYLGQLCRSNKIEAEKRGRSWFTTTEAIQSYLDNTFQPTISPTEAKPELVTEQVAEYPVVQFEPDAITEPTYSDLVTDQIEEEVNAVSAVDTTDTIEQFQPEEEEMTAFHIDEPLAEMETTRYEPSHISAVVGMPIALNAKVTAPLYYNSLKAVQTFAQVQEIKSEVSALRAQMDELNTKTSNTTEQVQNIPTNNFKNNFVSNFDLGQKPAPYNEPVEYTRSVTVVVSDAYDAVIAQLRSRVALLSISVAVLALILTGSFGLLRNSFLGNPDNAETVAYNPTVVPTQGKEIVAGLVAFEDKPNLNPQVLGTNIIVNNAQQPVTPITEAYLDQLILFNLENIIAQGWLGSTRTTSVDRTRSAPRTTSPLFKGGDFEGYNLTLYENATIEGTLTVGGGIAGPVNPGFTPGSIVFQGTTGLTQDNANFFWDVTNTRLGLGTDAPSATIDAMQTANGTNVISSRRFTDSSPTGNFIDFLTADGSDSLFSVDANGNTIIAGTLDVSGSTTTIGQLVSTRIPTLPHAFAPWPTGTSNASDATFYINPASAAPDTNLIAAAVNGDVKFLVDAEGDIYASNLILTGSTSTGTTIIAGDLTVQGNTTLGDSIADVLRIGGKTSINLAAPTALSGDLDIRQIANGDSIIYTRRFTDTLPTGSLIQFQNAAGSGNIVDIAAGAPVNSLILGSTGTLSLGTATPNASALLQLDSTTQGFLPPRLTTTQKNLISSPATGLVLYDESLNKLNVFNGTAWKNVGSTEVGGDVENGTIGSALFIGAGNLLAQDNTNFFFDDTTNRLGINDNTPAAALTVGAGDLFQVNSAGAIAAATGITTSGAVTLSTAPTTSVGSYDVITRNATTGVIEKVASSSFASSSGSTAYIQNTTSPQASSNFNISGDGVVGGTLTAATVNATSAIQLNGTNINTAGTLSNVAYLDQANTFSLNNTFSTSVTTPLITSATALALTPAAGANLNVNLSTTGDFAVNTNQLYVATSAASVGVGTTSPQATLDIRSAPANLTYTGIIGGTTAGIHISPSSSTAGYSNAITFGANNEASANAKAGIYVQTSSGYGSRMFLATTDDYSAGSKMRVSILENGNVGIGATDPYSRLSNVGTQVTDGSNGTSVSGFQWTLNDGGYAAAIVNSNTSNLANGLLLRAEGTGDALVVQGASNVNRFIVSSAGAITVGATPTTSAGSYDVITRNSSTGVIEKVASTTFATSSGSSSYIQNTTSPQASSNFNISGNGVVGGTLTAATVNATSAIQLNGTSINTAGTLSNVAYLNQANTFTANNIFNGTISSPGAGGNSERFGASSVAVGSNSLAVGSGASSGGSSSIALGRAANSSGGDGIAIGYASVASADATVAIGNSTTATVSSATAVGAYATATGSGCTGLGGGSTCAASFGLALGLGANAGSGHDYSIALGSGATTTAASQLIVGASTRPITDIYFGKGVTNAAPVVFTINGTGGSGTDIAGANVAIAAGKGTGNAASGDIIFQGSDVGSSGATLQTLATRVTIKGETGNVGIGDTTPLAALTVGSGDLFQVNSSGAIAAATGITTSGSVTLSTAPTTSAGSYDVITRNASTGVLEKVASTSFASSSGSTAYIQNTTSPQASSNFNISGNGTVGGTLTAAAIANSGSYTQTGTSANTFTGTSTFSNATYSALFTGGNVGIGTSTPAAKLEVQNGSVYLSN
ncbi:MAG: hypothetical protein M3Q64_00105, partial [bacterium]|nr:hypothetical protein [bacterium]